MEKRVVELSKLVHQASTGRMLCRGLFWIWGLIGLALVLGEVISASTMRAGTGVGIGTSGYILMETAVWIGGMVLFGLGALIGQVDFSLQRSPEQQPVDR